jgi:Icc-related predicted phosphoesterase
MTETNGTKKRPVRVAGASGGFSDRVHAISRLAANEDVDVIVGDWLSEMTMTIHGTGKIRNQEKFQGKELSWEEQVQNAMFAENFMDCFEPAIDDIAKKGIKIAVNAGASDTEILAKVVKKAVNDRGHNLKVAWVEGDEVTGAVKAMLENGEEFRSLMHNKSVKEWGLEPVTAQCYLGGLGIAKALTEGADIVICGRVSDASPIIGAAA